MIIPELGHFVLILALASAFLLAVLPPIAVFNKKFAYLQALTKPAVTSQCFFITIAFLTLTYCFIQDDFSVAYVAENSYSALPLIYKICAVWGAHEGSLLLWSFILSCWTFAFALRSYTARYQHITLSILGAINVGFLLLLLQTSNPFTRLLPYMPKEGVDLNPLLQDPGFVLHPPILYMGYVGLAVPYALAMTGMIFSKENMPWATLARPWALLAWAFLTVGITLGSWWAYYELGWGGWWFWDPVENASFMPWLLGAALAHALFMSMKQNTFNAWAAFLAISTFILSLLGTFLVRSGVVSSVHAFASDPLRGSFILGFLALVMLCSFGLYITRFSQTVRSQKVPFLSKESFLFLGNILFLVATMTVLLGTLYPLITEVLWHDKISVGPPYFNQVFIPLMLPLLVLMAIAPHVSWSQDTFAALKKKMKVTTFVFGSAAIVLGFFLIKILSWWAFVGVLVGGWILIATLGKVLTDVPQGRFSIKWTGMIFSHLGVGIAILGITLTTVLETEKEMSMKIGTSASIGQYTFSFNKLEDINGPNYQGKRGEFSIYTQGKHIGTLMPEKRFFIPRNLPMTETAIMPGLFRDFYIALGEPLENGNWTVRLYIKPFIRWIWLGGLLIALGAGFSSIQAFRQEKRIVKAE